MKPIDPHEAALRAEEARRRAEALARLRQPPPPASPPRAGTPSPPRTPPVDVVERMSPSLFGSLTGPAPQAGLDAELDRQMLAAALGPAATAAPAMTRPVPPVVPPRPPAVATHAGAGWARAASAVLGGPLASLAEKARWLEGRASQIRIALSASDTRNARTAVGFRVAGDFLEKAAYRAGLARELSKPVPGDLRTTLARLTAARQQLVDAQQHAGDAEGALRELAAKAREMPRTLQDVREMQQVASQARFETSRTESRGGMVASASETAASPAELGLGEDELARIGSGLDPSQPPPQASWSATSWARVSRGRPVVARAWKVSRAATVSLSGSRFLRLWRKPSDS